VVGRVRARHVPRADRCHLRCFAERTGESSRNEKLNRDLSLAWHTGAFVGAAWSGKLKKLSEYQDKKPTKQSPSEMLAVLQMLRDNGAPMNIRQIN
jgi:hypothetical protein